MALCLATVAPYRRMAYRIRNGVSLTDAMSIEGMVTLFAHLQCIMFFNGGYAVSAADGVLCGDEIQVETQFICPTTASTLPSTR